MTANPFLAQLSMNAFIEHEELSRSCVLPQSKPSSKSSDYSKTAPRVGFSQENRFWTGQWEKSGKNWEVLGTTAINQAIKCLYYSHKGQCIVSIVSIAMLCKYC